jgi:hypothetical protein
MGSLMYIVPVGDFDLAWHESAIRYVAKNRVELEGQIYPSDDDHAADTAQIRLVKKGLAALTPAQRKASRWPTPRELQKQIRALGEARGYKVWFGPYSGAWQQGSLTAYGKKDREIIGDLSVDLSRERGTYYCQADEDMLREFAQAVANVAGPQVTFLGEDYSPADFTALFLPAAAPEKTTKKSTKKPTKKTVKPTKAKTKKTKTKSRGRS